LCRLKGGQGSPGAGLRHETRSESMGKGNHSQKNDKKKLKPKQDKTKPAAKK
jgi:hypothetical protein